MALQTIQLGKILITHKGAWSNAVDYEALDVVSYRGSSYLAILDPPVGTLLSNGTYWRPLSKSAYEYAIEQGYEGTEEEFGILIGSISDIDTALGLKTDKTALETTEEVTAQSLVELKERVEALEEFIKQGLLNNILINNLSVENLQINGASLILSGNTVPAVAPDFIGQFYIKTTAPTACYQATGIAGVGDWKLIG